VRVSLTGSVAEKVGVSDGVGGGRVRLKEGVGGDRVTVEGETVQVGLRLRASLAVGVKDAD